MTKTILFGTHQSNTQPDGWPCDGPVVLVVDTSVMIGRGYEAATPLSYMRCMQCGDGSDDGKPFEVKPTAEVAEMIRIAQVVAVKGR